MDILDVIIIGSGWAGICTMKQKWNFKEIIRINMEVNQDLMRTFPQHSHPLLY